MFLKPNISAHKCGWAPSAIAAPRPAGTTSVFEPVAWLQIGQLELWHPFVIHGHLNVWDVTKCLPSSSSSTRNLLQLLHVTAAFLPSMAKRDSDP